MSILWTVERRNHEQKIHSKPTILTITAADYASDGSKPISRVAAGIVFIHHRTKFAALATGAGIATDATRPGEVAGGKVEDGFQQ